MLASLTKAPAPTFLGAFVLLVAGCEDPPGVLGPVTVDQAWVVGDAAAALDESGLFVLPKQDTAPGELSHDTAERMAVVWARTFGPGNQSLFERIHGSPIRFAELTACGRSFYAQTPYVPLPADALQPLKNLLGSYWIVTLCDDARVEKLRIGVAVKSATTVVNGQLAFSPVYGNDFRVSPIPPGVVLPVAPERAAQIAYEKTGVRITEPPAFMAPGKSVYPQGGRWQLRLERAIHATTDDGRRVTTNVIFVGPGRPGESDAVLVPAPNQPTFERMAVPVNGSTSVLQVALRQGAALRMDRVIRVDP